MLQKCATGRQARAACCRPWAATANLEANGKEGDQTVFHFHLHVVPRHGNDGIALSWPRKNPPRELLDAYAGQLHQALD